jgi:hypothetical protein
MYWFKWLLLLLFRSASPRVREISVPHRIRTDPDVVTAFCSCPRKAAHSVERRVQTDGRAFNLGEQRCPLE